MQLVHFITTPSHIIASERFVHTTEVFLLRTLATQPRHSFFWTRWTLPLRVSVTLSGIGIVLISFAWVTQHTTTLREIRGVENDVVRLEHEIIADEQEIPLLFTDLSQ